MNVVIAVPSGETMDAPMVQALTSLVGYTATNAGAGLRFGMINRQASSVAGNRNAIVKQALDAGAEWVLWIDSDMTFPPTTLTRLLAHKRPIVGATYNKRVHPYETLGRFIGDEGNPPRNGLIPALFMPGGIMLVSTEVYRRIGYPWYFETYYSPVPDPVDAFINRLRDLSFETVTPKIEALVRDNLADWIRADHEAGLAVRGEFNEISEDYNFCRKARQHGYGIFCDLDLTHEIGHVGTQVVTTLPGGNGHFYQNIQGWFEGAAARLYSRMVTEAEPIAHFVEVGAWKGRSTAYMAVEIANSGKRIQFDVVDHFKGSAEPQHREDQAVRSGTLRKVFETNIKPVRQFVNVLEMDSKAAAATYEDATLDFVYLDAGHDYAQVKSDILAWLPKVRHGGVLAGDDFNWPGVQQAVRELLPKDTVVVDNTQWMLRVVEAARVAA